MFIFLWRKADSCGRCWYCDEIIQHVWKIAWRFRHVTPDRGNIYKWRGQWGAYNDFCIFFEIQVWETILKVFFKWITILMFFLFCTQQNCLSRNYWPRWNKFPLHIIPFQYIEISGKMLIFIYKSFIEFCESTFF